MALVNDKLRKLYKDSKLTQGYIFEQIGMGRTSATVTSEYFTGSKCRDLDDFTLDKLAQFFKVGLEEYLLNDEVDILDNPQELYPYISKEDKEKQREKTIAKLGNYEEIDKEFQKDTLKLLERLNEITKGFNKIYGLGDEELIDFPIENLTDIGRIYNNQYYKLMYKKILSSLGEIIDYFENNKAISFYQATIKLNNIKKEIETLENYLNKLNQTISRIDKIRKHTQKYAKISEIANELYQKLYQSLQIENNQKVYDILLEFPEDDVISLVEIYCLLLNNDILHTAYDISNATEIEQYDKFMNILNNFRLQYVYSKNGEFLLESTPNTLERLYRFLTECYNDELVMRFVDKEYIRLEKEYKEWVLIAANHLK